MNMMSYLNFTHWAVVGDVLNESKYAHVIAKRLEEEGYVVYQVNPRSKSPLVYQDLQAIQGSIDILVLVIHPKIGLEIVQQATQLGINRVVIQPGADSDEIRLYCQQQGLEAIEGCILVTLDQREPRGSALKTSDYA